MKNKPNRIECPYCHKKVSIDKNNKICAHKDLFTACVNSNKIYKPSKDNTP